MSRGQTFIYLSGHTLRCRLSNQVPIKEQVLLVNVLSILGLRQPQGITKPKLPRRRVMLAGHKLESPITQLTDRRLHKCHPGVPSSHSLQFRFSGNRLGQTEMKTSLEHGGLTGGK
jgi:hypothetical protein